MTAEETRAELERRAEPCAVDADALLREGGDWLATARSFVQRKALNGNSVTWGSGEAVSLSMAQLEEMAARAVAVDRSRLLTEIAAVLDCMPSACVVRVREGGGPENLAASLAVSVGKLARQAEFAEHARQTFEDQLNDKLARLGDRNADVARLYEALRNTRTHLAGIRAAGVAETNRLCELAGLGSWDGLIARITHAMAHAALGADANGPHVYLGRASCGCVMQSVVDSPEEKYGTADTVAEMIREGLTVERVHGDDERNRTDRCEHGEGEPA